MSFSLGFWLVSISLAAQLHDPPDRGEPGDQMIQDYLRQETEKLEADFLGGVRTADDWQAVRPRFLREYLYMLGLDPMPEKTPLHPTVTRTLNRGDYVVDMLHYQSRPGLYVTANLFRPAQAGAGRRLPAILYVCGHWNQGRDGNKTACQSHGIWFARHGYVCLVVDTLQLGEIAGIHHGTYREGRWWWLARGYTPAGVEAWNGIRGIDYLLTRPDVDPERIGVTGISGGGAATFWITAADEHVRAAVPVSGMADLRSYVPNRVVNGHCDCMFLYNTYQWPWTRIAALVAPRPLLFVNSDHDDIFPMDANERVINRLERVYSLFGAGDVVDSVVSLGGHAYRKDIRQAAFRWMNLWFHNDARIVQDSEVDLVSGPRENVYPIPPAQLRVFPQDSDIPADARNGRIDREFVPIAEVHPPAPGGFEAWKTGLLASLRQYVFHHFPERIPGAKPAVEDTSSGVARLSTEPGITIRLRTLRTTPTGQRAYVLVTSSDAMTALPAWLNAAIPDHSGVYVCEPRGIGASRWTRKSPPNYVERSHYLLGRTVDSGRVWDLVATTRYLHEHFGAQVFLAGEGAAAALAIYAAVLEPDVNGLVLEQPPATHMDDSAPRLLNVLRVCDLPDALGLVAPRPVTVRGVSSSWLDHASASYRAAGAADKLVARP